MNFKLDLSDSRPTRLLWPIWQFKFYGMSVPPAPSASRGQVIIQPSYFTSSLYVEPLREDITALINAFHDQYTETQPTQPFTLFKNIWRNEWMWMHFKVFDSRTRETFLDVTMRLFLGMS
jgi:hypothetical protein